jgi:RNA polymerase sigma factor (sigma-70 family)
MTPFESIIDEHGAVVLRVCRALLQPLDADEAWSETFLAAFRAYENVNSDANIRGWLVTIAHRKAIDVLRSTKRRPTPIEMLPERSVVDFDRLETSSADVDVDALRAAIGRLPEKQRKAVAYRYLGELAYVDIAALLECSQAAARRSVSDGLTALRKQNPPCGTLIDSKGRGE